VTRRSLRSWLWRVPIDQEVEEELAFHIEMRRREGRPIDAADVERVRRTCVEIARKRDREMRLTTWLEERRTDIRFALRQLRRAPGFTAIAVLTLALGIGANSAIFALADATFFRSLPFTHPADRLVMIGETRGPGTFSTVSPADYADWDDQNQTLAATAAMFLGLGRIAGPDGAPEQVLAESVTVRFFDVLGVTPLVGRTFRDSDLKPSANAVVVGEAFWRSRLGADPAAVGRSLVLNGRPLDLVGVVPASFELVPPIGRLTGGPPPQIWMLAETAPTASPPSRQSHLLVVVGRLKPGVSLDRAQADLDVIAARLAEQFPESNKGHGVTVQPLRDALIGPDVRLTSILLLGVVGFVLLMCCANVASLLLAQATGRSRELAVRVALGAGRRRVVAQLLTESLVLASIGGVVALGVAAALLAAAPSFIPPGVLPDAVNVSFDGRVAAVCALTALAVGVLFGLAPVWQSMRGRLADAVSAEGRITRRGGWLRSGLVSVQVAAAVLVLCGAGLLLRTLITLQNMDSGFRTREVLTGMINLPVPTANAPSPYPSADSVMRFYEAVEREVRATPGVRRMAWGTVPPLDGTFFGQSFAIAGDPPKPMASRDTAAYHMVSPAYFETLGIPIVAGRGFTDADAANAPAVCLVSEAFVEQHVRGRNPIGMRLELTRVRHMLDTQTEATPSVEIVGVVRQVKAAAAETQPRPQVYVPLAQNRWWIASLVVQPERGDAAALAAPVRAAIARVDRDRVLARVRTMATIADDATARQRFRAVLVGAFAALALLLAMVGIFGVLSRSVQQRMREFGVRIALGASRQNVIGLVLGQATRITLAGLVAGLALAAMLGRLMGTLIYPVTPSDPLTFVVVPIVATLTAAAACVAPAWRATRVDPATAFRDE
jgi:putative ABC transport system permease protein